MMGVLFAMTEPFVNAVGRPVAKGWARLTGLPGKTLAIIFLFFSIACLIVDVRADLLARRPLAWTMMGLTCLAAPMWIRDIERVADEYDDEVRVVGWQEGFLRFLLVINLLSAGSAVGTIVSKGAGWAGLGDDAAFALAMMVALAKQGSCRSVFADLRARRGLRPATVPS